MQVQKFTILEKDFSVYGDELGKHPSIINNYLSNNYFCLKGSTLKLRRHVVVNKYATQIDAMYKMI